MGFKQDFKKATQELKKKKKQESTGFKSDFQNALEEIRNNAGQSRNKTTLTPTIQTTKTNQNLVTNPLIKGMVNEADKTSASNRVDVRELATNFLVRDIEDRAKEIAQDNYQKSRALSAMRRTPSASAGGDFMNDFLSSDAFYYNLSDNEDFEEYVKKGRDRARAKRDILPSKDVNFDKYTMGNRIVEAKNGIDVSMHYDGAGGKVGQMTDDEVDIYNYLLAKNGYDSAEAYVKSLEGELTNRLGKGVADAIENSSLIAKPILDEGLALATAMTGDIGAIWGSLPAYFRGDEDVVPTNAFEIASEERYDDMGEFGRAITGATRSGAAILPAVAAGTATTIFAPGAAKYVGGGITALQSAAGAYRQDVLSGRDPKSARGKATAIGLSEGFGFILGNTLGKALGIGPEKIDALTSLIANNGLRAATKLGIDLVTEISEEEAQLIIEKAADSIFYGDEFNLPNKEEIKDTAIQTALVTFGYNGGDIAKNYNADNSKLGQEFRGYNDKDTDIVQVAIEEGLSTPKGSESYTMAKALDKKVKNGGEVSDHQLGTLIEANRRNVNYEAEADVDTTSSETFTQDTRGMSLEDRIRQAKAKEDVTLETPIAINPNAKVGTVDQKTIKSFGYGKTGTAAITYIVSKTNMAPEQARRRFQSAYEAGRLNLDRSKVDLLDNIQETAYIAGGQDAILEMDTLEGNDVSSWGKKSGLVRNEFSAKYDKKTYSTINTIAKAMGTKVIVENIPQEMNSNGYYRSSDGTIHIDANLDEPVMTVVKHEITHRMKDLAPKEYMAYRDFAVEVMSDWGLGSKTAVESIQFDYHDRGNIDLDVESAMDEIAADMTRAILSDEKALRRFIDHAKTSKANMNMANKFFQAVREFINKIKTTFSGNRQKMDEATRDEFGLTLEQLERAESLWKEAYRASEMSAKKINEAKIKTTSPESGAVYDKSGTRFDAERLSSSELGGVLYSLKHNNDIAEGQNKYLNTKKSYISEAELKQAQEVTRAMVDVMMKYSSILPEDKIGKVLTKNGSYDRSVENTTICVRTLAYNEFVDKVQEELGRPLSQMESFLVSQKMYDIATDPQCMYCYVSLDRKAFNDMLLRYIQDRDTVIEKYNKSDKLPKTVERLYEEFLNKRKDTKEMRSRFNKWIDYVDNGTQILSLADIATEDSQSAIKAKGGVLAEQLADARKYAQSASWAKIQKNYVAYRDEILKLGDRVVKNLNEHYGLRWYSFSDYSAAFIVENMQQITDASIRGLKGLAYTKDTDFVEIFAPSGMNINISVFVNKDADGKFYIDERQSANIKKAIELRKQYPNVGIVATVTTDEALRWAAEQEWSDVIIPFHIVRTGADVAEYYKWLNYTNESGDSVKDNDLWSAYVDSLNIKSESARRKVSKNIYPSEHNNDKDTYLNLCESRGLTPRFARFTGEDWYMKLVNETRLSADKSSPLKPKYNLDAAQKSFQKFINKGGYEGGWYKNGVDIDAEAKAVADDVRAGKKANEVEYGRQDGFLPEEVAAKRRNLRMHGNDIYLSLKGESKIMKDYARLKKINEQLKEQFKLTTVTKADRKSLEKFTKELLKDYSSKADLDTTIDSLDSLLIYMVNKQDGQYADFNEVMRRAEGIASYILKESVEVDNELYNQYADLRKYLRTTPIKFDNAIDEVPIGYDGFSDFKKQNMGKLKFTNDGISIEAMYGELSELYPEFFNSQEEVTSSDKFGKIVEVLNALKPLEFNPYESDIEDATQFLADDIVNRVFQLPAQKPTFADKQKQKLDDQKAKSQEKIEKLRAEKNKRISELIKENRERVKEVRQEQIKKKNEAVEKISQKYKDSTDKGRELRKAKALRDKITSHANELSKKLLKGTDKQHIPQELQGPVAKLLECINLESNYTYDKSSGSYKKNDEGLPSRRTVAFNELREAYAKISSSVVVDPDLMGEDGLLSSVISLANKRIVDMTSDELNTVWQAIRAIEASVNTANKLFSQSKFESISGIAEEMKVQNAGKKYKSEFQGLVGDGKKLTALDMLTPETYFHFLGNAGDSIFRMMRDAQDKHIMITEETENFTHTELPEAKVNELENKLHTVTLGGEKIKLSTAQLMELYVLMKRNQAAEHILVGGILPDVTKSKVTRVKPIRDITVDEVSDALSLLTDEQKQIADKLQRYASDVLSKYGNEASMQVYNYKKFNEENYWPIRTNKQEIKSDIEKDTAVTTVANKGMTKSTKPHANTSIRLGSIFDTFSSHSADMATYAAWLGASEDVNRIRNFVFWDDGVRRGTVKEILDTVHGTHGSKYLEKLLTDVSIGVKGTDELGMIDKITGNYKAASVGANIRVIIQQPTAILRAMDMLGPQYFVAGVGNPIKGWEKAKKYAPIAQWKDWGYFDINTGRQMKDILFDNARGLDKIKQAGMWGASTADSLSWGQLWNAVEAETKFKHKDLKVGSKEYYEAVARRFTEIVDHTQVVDGIMQRSQIMRSSDKFAKMATPFMGEPTKEYNMMVSAAYDAKNTKGAERKRAVARLGRTATSLAISGILKACAQSIIDALRDDDKEEKYWEKWLEAFIGYGDDAKWYESNLVDAANPLSYIPLAKDLMSILRGYDVKRMDTEAIAKTYRASENLYKAITGTGKYTIAEGSAQVFAEVSRLFGLPVANLKRDAESIIMTTAIETDNYLMQYYIDKTLLNIEYKTNKSDFVKILFNAYNNDQEAYEVIYNDLIKEGYTDSEIKKKMENFMKKKENVNDVSDLSKRYYAPTQEGQYDAIVNELQNSDIWNDADEEKQKKVYDTINEYFSGEGETSEELRREIEDGKKYGVDESEYLLYKLALQMVDQDEGKKGYGSYSLSEKAEAISMQNLSNDELAYLWDTEEGWKAYKKGIRMSKYIDFKDASSGFKADKDKNGKSISDSKKEKVVKYLNKSKLSDKEWDYFFYELMGYKNKEV